MATANPDNIEKLMKTASPHLSGVNLRLNSLLYDFRIISALVSDEDIAALLLTLTTPELAAIEDRVVSDQIDLGISGHDHSSHQSAAAAYAT
jgi:hypothetical protein